MTKANETTDLAIKPDMAPRAPEEFGYMERLDEAQIIAEYQGQVMERVFYSFHSGGRQVVGISYAGVKELAADMASKGMMLIDVEDVEVHCAEMPLDNAKRLQIAKRRAGGDEAWKEMGRAERQAALDDIEDYWPTYIAKAHAVERRQDGTVIRGNFGVADNDAKEPMGLRKAASKAIRNAMRALMPEARILAFVDQAMKRELGEAKGAGAQGRGSGGRDSKPRPTSSRGKKKTTREKELERNEPPKEERKKLSDSVPEFKWAKRAWGLLEDTIADEEIRADTLSDALRVSTEGRLAKWDRETIKMLTMTEINEADKIIDAIAKTGDPDVASVLSSMGREEDARFLEEPHPQDAEYWEDGGDDEQAS